MQKRGVLAAAVLAAVALLLWSAGCGRKAPPEPRSARIAAAYDHGGKR
jgi:predicted small lipoprotein YifL